MLVRKDSLAFRFLGLMLCDFFRFIVTSGSRCGVLDELATPFPQHSLRNDVDTPVICVLVVVNLFDKVPHGIKVGLAGYFIGLVDGAFERLGINFRQGFPKLDEAHRVFHSRSFASLSLKEGHRGGHTGVLKPLLDLRFDYSDYAEVPE